jgi:P-type Cu+ transporter
VDFIGEQHKDDIIESIRDIGYDATINSVTDLNKFQNSSESRIIQRTVNILVDSIYCEHCPPRILASLEGFGDRVKVKKPLNLQEPILRLTYTPHIPDFTIRNIIATISAVNHSIDPSIYHPPTLKERSRQIHAREQLRLLIQVLLTLFIAILTLIIGIVFMSLVSSNNPSRQLLMRPLRAGISRAQ